MKIHELKLNQVFESYVSNKTFKIISITKSKIEFVDLGTGEIHETTKNDNTCFFEVKKQ